MTTSGSNTTGCRRGLQVAARVVLAAFGRLRVTGAVPDGPVILAANHISPVDPVVLLAACHAIGVAPRVMATAGVFRAPVVGAVLRRAGYLRVARGTASVTQALHDAIEAVAAGDPVLIYPEGRIGLAPGMWPERGKTGVARLAEATGVPVVPVAQWGAHEIAPYAAPRGAVRGLARSVLRRPQVSVHFGRPVSLAGTGSAREATDRVMAAIADALLPLRAAEPDVPRWHDPTRPIDPSRARLAP
ncbi:lysophospholipid acyltransferase family protein [Phytohabitans aurantiacus]|uniref:lysophospholipid acyltransferase family protein n=1 Tax=Phytohabitans aurantiacus TaxID=3016789 RepID=UPI00389AAFD2